MTVTHHPTPAVDQLATRRRDGELHGLLDCATNLLVPCPCLGCEAPLGAQAPAMGLCLACRGELKRPPRPACATCSRHLSAADPPPGHRCRRCRATPPAFDRLLVAWLYAPPLDAAIRALKFSRRERIGRGLAAELAAVVEADLGPAPELIVPVPLHWRRRLIRGYDQAERIARPLARRLGLPFGRPLRRRHATIAQTSLGRAERRLNPHGAFAIAPRRGVTQVAGRRVLLVDDVATTGATLDAAARCLRAAGAASVVAAAAALSPEPEAVAVSREPNGARERIIRQITRV